MYLLYKKLYLLLYRLFDGMILMTKELCEYFVNIGQNKVFHLPMSVDHDRFSIKKKNEIMKPYFAYCGGGDYDRDECPEVVSLLRSRD